MKKGIANVEGKTFVITGAARGIGRALAHQALEAGARVALVDIDMQALDEAAAASTAPERCSTHVVDVSVRSQVEALPEHVLAAHPSVDVLINNAGIAYEGPFSEMTLDTFEHVMGINFWGVVYGCSVFLPHLAKAPVAHIVNLSSLFGIVGMPGQTAYCASKFAVRGFSECLWEELRTTRIGLTVVHPGGVATNIMKACEGEDPEILETLRTWYERHAMAPEIAAKKIHRAIRKGNPRLLITSEAYVADYVRRLLPVMGNRLASEIAIRSLGLTHIKARRTEQWERNMVGGDDA